MFYFRTTKTTVLIRGMARHENQSYMCESNPSISLYIKEIKMKLLKPTMILRETMMIKMGIKLHSELFPLLIDCSVRPLREAKGREESHDMDPFLCISLVVNMPNDTIEENNDNEDVKTLYDRKPDHLVEHHGRLHRSRGYWGIGTPCEIWKDT